MAVLSGFYSLFSRKKKLKVVNFDYKVMIVILKYSSVSALCCGCGSLKDIT